MRNFHQNGKNIIKTPIKQKKSGLYWGVNRMRMNSGGSVAQKPHCVSISIRSCRTRCGVWSQGASGAAAAKNERGGKKASIDSIVTEARSVRDPTDACANCRRSREGWWRWWGCKKKKKNHSGPFRPSLSAAAPSEDSRDIESRQQKQISIRLSEREEALCWEKGGLNGRHSLELYSRKLYSRVSRNMRSLANSHAPPLLLIAELFFPSFLEKKENKTLLLFVCFFCEDVACWINVLWITRT